MVRCSLLLVAIFAACVPSQRSREDMMLRQLPSDVLAHTIGSAPLTITEVGGELSRSRVIELALAHNQHLAVELAKLGVPIAELASAVSPGNLEIELLAAGSVTELNTLFDVGSLLTLYAKRSGAKAALAAQELMLQGKLIDTIAAAEIAYRNTLFAQQLVELRTAANDAALASLAFVVAQHESGNQTDLALLREQDNQAQTEYDLAGATRELAKAQSELAQTIGFAVDAGSNALVVVADAAENPKLSLGHQFVDQAVAANFARRAMQQRKAQADAALSVARVQTFLPTLGAGVAAVRVSGRDGTPVWSAGPAVAVGLPIFAWNRGDRAKARADQSIALKQQAAAEVAVRAVATRLLGEAQALQKRSVDLTEKILPLRAKILKEVTLHYNAMNATPLELMIARRAQIEANVQAIENNRDLWIVSAKMAALLAGGSAMQLDEGNDD